VISVSQHGAGTAWEILNILRRAGDHALPFWAEEPHSCPKELFLENLIGCKSLSAIPHPLLHAHHVASGFSMSTVTQTEAAVVAVSYALTIAAAKGVIAEGP
jgi:hypothetical protein